MIGFIRRLIHGLDRQLGALETAIQAGFGRQEQQMSALDDRISDLSNRVQAMGDQVASANAVLSHVQQEIKDGIQAGLQAGASQDQLSRLQALSDALASQAGSLAQAIASEGGQSGQPSPDQGQQPGNGGNGGTQQPGNGGTGGQPSAPTPENPAGGTDTGSGGAQPSG
jgi:hypothetical protein